METNTAIKIEGSLRPNQCETPNVKMSINPNTSSDFSNRLVVTLINEFHKSLEDDFEAGVSLDHSGQKVTFRVSHIGHLNPSLIAFRGYKENGSPVNYVKHLSQINIDLVKLKRESTNEPKKPLGFRSWNEFENYKI